MHALIPWTLQDHGLAGHLIFDFRFSICDYRCCATSRTHRSGYYRDYNAKRADFIRDQSDSCSWDRAWPTRSSIIAHLIAGDRGLRGMEFAKGTVNTMERH